MKFKIISFSSAEVMFCFADILAKVLLTMLLSNASVEQSHAEKLKDLSKIANGMEQALSNTEALLERMMPRESIEQLKRGDAPDAEEYESVR